MINNQFIPSIIELNWGNSEELPFLEVELNRPEKDKQIVERDKTLFVDMGLPVSKQWLYDRHKVPAPGPKEDIFNPGTQISRSASSEEKPSENKGRAQSPDKPPTSAKHSCTCPELVEGASESDASYQGRKAQAATDFAKLLQNTNLKTHDLIWTSGDCPVCDPLNGTTYPDGWTTPLPLHHNCDCAISVQPKANKT